MVSPKFLLPELLLKSEVGAVGTLFAHGFFLSRHSPLRQTQAISRHILHVESFFATVCLLHRGGYWTTIGFYSGNFFDMSIFDILKGLLIVKPSIS